MFSRRTLMAAAASSGFDTSSVSQSAWFDGSADYLSKTFASDGDLTEWTLSAWVQRTETGVRHTIYGDNGGTNQDDLRIESDDSLRFIQVRSSLVTDIRTNALFRDVGWYHIVISYDSDNATAADRLKMYVNGERITSFQTNDTVDSGRNSTINSTETNYVGAVGTASPIDGYIAQITLLDGYSIQNGDIVITDLGREVAAGDNGTIWAPRPDADIVALADTAGGNSFALTSAIGDGTDASSNGNNFTPTSMSHAANGSTNTPSNVHAIWSAIDSWNTGGGSINGSFATGNKEYVGAGTGNDLTVATLAFSSGTKYWEVVCNSTSVDFGVLDIAAGTPSTFSNSLGDLSFGYAYRNNGNKESGASEVAYGDSFTNGDVIGILLDADSGDLTFYKNGTSQGVAYSGLSGTFAPACAQGSTGNEGDWTVRFQESEWTQTPAGINGTNALNSANLATPTYIGADYFNAVTYTGTGGDQSVTGFGFQPDFLWDKCRSNAEDHGLFDAIRGATNRLESNNIDAETTTSSIVLQSFDADGFTGPSGTPGNVTVSGRTYVGWGFKANGSGVANSDGSISSTVSVAEPGHFSIVSYTGTGAAATVGHGLGATPDFMIVKGRDSAGNWTVYHSSNTSEPETDNLALNLTNATADNANAWNDTAPTSSVFTVGVGTAVNTSAEDYVAYLWSEVPGVSKVGSYTGNGSTDGPYVQCGFRPRWILIKVTTQAYAWYTIDTARTPRNPTTLNLYSDLANAEDTDDALDVLSNGFKPRSSGVGKNQSGQNYIFIAIADVAGGGELPPIPGR